MATWRWGQLEQDPLVPARRLRSQCQKKKKRGGGTFATFVPLTIQVGTWGGIFGLNSVAKHQPCLSQVPEWNQVFMAWSPSVTSLVPKVRPGEGRQSGVVCCGRVYPSNPIRSG
jgi:hypothetical protein